MLSLYKKFKNEQNRDALYKTLPFLRAMFLRVLVCPSLQQFWLNKQQIFKLRKKKDVIRAGEGGGEGDKENLQNFFNFFKGNPNFQGILNWILILHIMHYYCRKQHKISKTHRLMDKMLMSLCPSLFTATCCTPFSLPSGRVFSVLGLITLQNYVEF